MREGQTLLRAALVAVLFVHAGHLPAQDKPKQAPTRPPRLLYVVDAVTLAPIAGAEVRDLMTRNTMKTSDAGMIGLLVPGFVKATGALIQVRKAGYRSSDQMLVDPMVDTTLVIHLLSDSAAKAKVARQRKDSTVFFVDILDERGEGMTDARVSIISGLTQTLDSSGTDTTGLAQLQVPGAAGDVQIKVTRLGYQQYRQFYQMSVADTIIAQVAMRRVAQQLGAINVTARRKRIYSLDENEIAKSKRPIGNALEAVTKLKPAMFGDRLRDMDGCGTVDYIYVNGRRIFTPPDDAIMPRIPPARVSSRSTRGQTSILMRNTAPMAPKQYGANNGVRAVLSVIKPEHIAEMTYVDCSDTTIPGLHVNNAMYVVLKYGVEYDDRRGSVFTKDSAITRKPSPKK
jgi:hypothetical protein